VVPRARRLCALAVVLALSAGVSLRVPHGCVVCPPGCPMHARRTAGAAEPERKLGCHRAPAPMRADVCVRSACGRDAEAGTPFVLMGVLARATAPVTAAPPRPLALASARTVSRFLPAPPTEPPRALHG
jgi:hypothetical protein